MELIHLSLFRGAAGRTVRIRWGPEPFLCAVSMLEFKCMVFRLPLPVQRQGFWGSANCLIFLMFGGWMNAYRWYRYFILPFGCSKCSVYHTVAPTGSKCDESGLTVAPLTHQPLPCKYLTTLALFPPQACTCIQAKALE